jgi:hypothetical protein
MITFFQRSSWDLFKKLNSKDKSLLIKKCYRVITVNDHSWYKFDGQC